MIHHGSSKPKQALCASVIYLHSPSVALSFKPLKIWVLHLSNINWISSNNKPNEYICGTLCCIHYQRGKPLTSFVVFFQSWTSCCLDHISLSFYSNAATSLVNAYWLELSGVPFICSCLMFNATRHSSAQDGAMGVCVCVCEYSSVTHVTAAGQLLSCSSVLI